MVIGLWPPQHTNVRLASVICFLLRQASAGVGFAQRWTFWPNLAPTPVLAVRYARVGVQGAACGWRVARCPVQRRASQVIDRTSGPQPSHSRHRAQGVVLFSKLQHAASIPESPLQPSPRASLEFLNFVTTSTMALRTMYEALPSLCRNLLQQLPEFQTLKDIWLLL